MPGITVLTEMETIRRILKRRLGCARFGDGEIGLALCQAGARGQDYAADLAKALRRVATSNLPNLLVCIPRIFGKIPAAKFRWERWRLPERSALWEPGREYGSAFISRPDFWGEPFGEEYWATMRSIWDTRPVLLVRGDARVPALFDNAASVEVIEGPNRNAWAGYHDVLARCLEWDSKQKKGAVIAQLGPTATVLAYDCAVHGVQCLDLGKASRFYRDEIRR